MILKARNIVALALAVGLSGCGGLGGACSGVELSLEESERSLDAFIRNTSDEAKLVTMTIIKADGEEGDSQTVRIEAGDFFETQVTNPRGSTIELTECK
jgi:hypothetical protein